MASVSGDDIDGCEWIRHDGRALAFIIRRSFQKPGITFFTPSEFSQQMAFMRHPAGKRIEAHVHNRVDRTVSFTQEVLVIRSGLLRVDFYAGPGSYLESRELRAGDVILLVSGGHGFQVLEEVEMIEIKQGPHAGEGDKTRFPSVEEHRLRIGHPEP